ncbi:MAG: hypothetical protein N2485_01355 [bacterium]|nr:hypothetical protein [bacterium]
MKKLIFLSSLFLYILLGLGLIKIFSSNLEKVLIIKGKDIEPVNLTVQGFLSQYPSDLCDIYNLKDIKKIDINRYQVIIALTSEAAYQLKNYNLKNKLVIYGLVLSPEKLGVLGKFIGFSIYPPFEQVFKDLKQRYPNIKSVGLVFNQKNYAVEEAYKAAKNLNLNCILIPIDNYNYRNALKQIEKVDIVYLFSDSIVLEENNLLFLINSIKSLNKIIVSAHKVLLKYGADAAYSIDYFQLGTNIANIIKKNDSLVYDNTYKVYFPYPYVYTTK